MEQYGEFFKVFGQTKIPSLLLLLLIYSVGVILLINSEKNQDVFYVGCVVLLVAGILSIITYCDYRNKEYYDGIINHFQSALTSISNTHSRFEEHSQSTMTGGTQGSPTGHSGEYTTTSILGTENH